MEQGGGQSESEDGRAEEMLCVFLWNRAVLSCWCQFSGCCYFGGAVGQNVEKSCFFTAIATRPCKVCICQRTCSVGHSSSWRSLLGVCMYVTPWQYCLHSIAKV